MRTIKLLFLFVIFSFSTNAFSQDYNLGLGLRLGSPLSISAKKFVSEKSAFEVYAGFRNYVGFNWMNISAAYLLHNPIDAVDGLKYYYGVGGSMYIYSYDVGFGSDFADTGFGVQGYLGLEYVFSDIPLSVTADWIPTIFIGNGFLGGFGGGYGSLGVRYSIK